MSICMCGAFWHFSLSRYFIKLRKPHAVFPSVFASTPFMATMAEELLPEMRFTIATQVASAECWGGDRATA